MEVRKDDAVFKFLPTNSDNCGFLFCLEGTRRMNEKEKAFMALKTELDDQKVKKVRFNQKKLRKVRDNEKVPTKEIVDKNKKRKGL